MPYKDKKRHAQYMRVWRAQRRQEILEMRKELEKLRKLVRGKR